MPDYRATCPKGHEIVAILQLAPGEATIKNFARNKTPMYTGHTETFPDIQQAFAQERGSGLRGWRVVADDAPEARYRCDGGCGEITYDQLTFEALP
jgi:hypothetical protein